MQIEKLKNIVLSLICLVVFCTGLIAGSAFADDTSMLKAFYDFNDLNVGANPPPELANSSCKGTGSAKIAEDEETGNKYMRMECSYSGNDQALVSYDKISGLTGSMYIEFDFLSENSYGRIPVALNVKKADGSTTNLYPLIIQYASFNKDDWSVKIPGSLNIHNGAEEKAAMERIDNTWYNVKCYTNLDNKKMTVIITEEGKEPQTFEYTMGVDAVSYHYLRFTIPGWSIQNLTPEGEYAKCRIDNIKVENFPSLKLVSSNPENQGGDAFPAQPLELKFNNKPEEFELEIDGEKISNDMISVSADGKTYTYKPSFDKPWMWDETYEYFVRAVDAFGVTSEDNQSFTVKSQPEMWIESLGFFDADGNEISQIANGTISSKMRFWQSVDSKYASFIALYKEHNGRVEMVSLSCNELEVEESTEPTVKDIPVSVNIPEGSEDSYFVKVYVWKSLTDRTAYAKDVCYGTRTLN